MSDLIDREHVIDFLKLTRDSEYEKSMSAEVKHKSIIRSKHDAHVAFCDYLIEYVNQVPTHPTPSNTLGALDCIDRQEAIKALCREECGMDPKGCCVGTCYDVEIIEDVPSVQLELSNNSPELDNKNGELISRQKAKDAIDMALDHIDHVPPWVYDKLLNALNEVPSVQPETNCSEIPNNSDLISRQAAIDALDKRFDSVPMEQTTEILMLRKDLRELPSSQPRNGKWIITSTFDDCYYAKCDQCHETQVFYYNKPLTNFCPNCGCRMEEGDSDEKD